MTSQSREQKIKSIIKGNQAMKSGQLVEYKMRNFFFEKSCSKCGGEITSSMVYCT